MAYKQKSSPFKQTINVTKTTSRHPVKKTKKEHKMVTLPGIGNNGSKMVTLPGTGKSAKMVKF